MTDYSKQQAALRGASAELQNAEKIDVRHSRWRPVSMLRARRSNRFTEWDGNLSALADDSWLELQKAVSPTSLEDYAVGEGREINAAELTQLRSQQILPPEPNPR